MQPEATFGARVNVVLTIHDARTRQVRGVIRGHNLVTNTGLNVVANGLAGVSSEITHLGFGSGTNPPASGDTGLLTPLGQFAITRVSASGVTATAEHYLSSGLLNGSTIREAGLFASGILVARFVFNDADLQPKTSAVAVTTSWTITGMAV